MKKLYNRAKQKEIEHNETSWDAVRAYTSTPNRDGVYVVTLSNASGSRTVQFTHGGTTNGTNRYIR